MRIFVDESGNFAPGTGVSRTCCIAALVVPDAQARDLVREFVDLRTTWTAEQEIKSNELTDEQSIAALTLMAHYDVVAMITAYDRLHHPPEQLKAFQDVQAQGFTNGLTPEHEEEARHAVETLRDEWLRLSPQLMAQLHLMISTVEDAIRFLPNYYAQHMPQELGRWDWVIDPKDIRPTRYEIVWRQIVCPIVQTASQRAPFMRIVELDYSAFERYVRDIPDNVHPALRGWSPSGDGRAYDLNLLLRESVAFPDSRDEPGLQLADIVAGTFTKAMNGILNAPVWRLLGPLMLQRPQGEPAARMAVLGDGPRFPVENYHQNVLQALTNRAKRYFKTDEPPAARA